MSRLIFGSTSLSLVKVSSRGCSGGKMFPVSFAGCGCRCHTTARLCIRTLSSHHGVRTEQRRCLQTSNNPHACVHVMTRPNISLKSSLFSSNYLLHPWTSASVLGRIHMDSLFCHPLSASNVCNVQSLLSSSPATCRFHTSPLLSKEESKVEKSVKALKEQAEKLEKKEEEQAAPLEQQPAKAEEAATVTPAKKSLWQRFVAELKHYYHGFRLLFIDIRICCRFLWNVLQGKTLTRRERRQLVRTTADIFRLVPFLVFILVPFMEFLLPVAVKLFPNMLPSTFAEEDKEKEKRKKQLKLKLEMAKFLQDTIHETALQKKKKKKGSAAEEFSTFVEKIRSQGIRPTTEEILKFAKLFEDEITLDNLSRQQLQAVCRVLGLQPIGIDALLRFQLDMKLRQLKADDKMIIKEGVDSLSMAELQAANRARGMRALGVSGDRLRAQLQQWLTLHVEERIPTSLLLLSRALYLPETLSTEQQLEATITKLTETAPSAAEEVKLKAAELAGEQVDNKTRLEVIKKEEGIIAAESKARKEEEAAELEEKARQELHEREAAEAAAGQAAMEIKETLRDEAPVTEPAKTEELLDTAAEVKGLEGEELAMQKEKEEEPITAQELEELECALEELAEHKKINIELEELQDLKQEVNEYKEDLEDLKDVMVLTGKEQDDMVESKAAKRLIKRVDRLIHQADSVIVELQAEKEKMQEEKEVGEVPLKHKAELQTDEKKVEEVMQEEVEVGEVRLRRNAELKADEKKVEEVMQRISQSKDNIVSINEMLLAMKRLQKVPNDTKLQRIVEVLDEDHDGQINVNLALKVLETLAQENVKLSKVQVTEMVNLLKAEMELEEEEKMKQKMEKENKDQQKQVAEG